MEKLYEINCIRWKIFPKHDVLTKEEEEKIKEKQTTYKIETLCLMFILLITELVMAKYLRMSRASTLTLTDRPSLIIRLKYI